MRLVLWRSLTRNLPMNEIAAAGDADLRMPPPPECSELVAPRVQQIVVTTIGDVVAEECGIRPFVTDARDALTRIPLRLRNVEFVATLPIQPTRRLVRIAGELEDPGLIECVGGRQQSPLS